MRRRLLYVGHFTFFTAFVPLFLHGLARYSRLLLNAPAFSTGYVGIFIGTVTIIAGVATMIRAEMDMYRFGGGGTPIPFYDPPRRLVREGIYRCTRNPMYLGTTLEYTGIGLILNEHLMILFSLITLSLAMTLYKLYEVPYLQKKFNDEFSEYLASTPALLPKATCLKGLIKGEFRETIQRRSG